MPNPNDGVIAAYADTLSNAGGTINGPLTVTGALTAPSLISSPPLAAGYLGQSVSPDVLSPTAVVLTTAYGYLTRVNVPVAGTSTYLDVVLTSGGTVTNAIWGLYTGTGVNPVAWTAQSSGAVTGAAGLYSIPWVTPVALAPGFYYVFQEVTGTTPSMPAVTATTTGSIGATILNPNCSLAGGTLNSALLASGAVTTIGATTQLAWGTSWAFAASKLWYGIR
jgi:hypothetical protein